MSAVRATGERPVPRRGRRDRIENGILGIKRSSRSPPRSHVRPARTNADEPPWWTRLRCEFVVRVTDTNNQPLAGVLVEIIGGREVGRRAATDRLGSSSVPGLGRELVTVQATKEGFMDWTGWSTLCGSGGTGRRALRMKDMCTGVEIHRSELRRDARTRKSLNRH